MRSPRGRASSSVTYVATGSRRGKSGVTTIPRCSTESPSWKASSGMGLLSTEREGQCSATTGLRLALGARRTPAAALEVPGLLVQGLPRRRVVAEQLDVRVAKLVRVLGET